MVLELFIAWDTETPHNKQLTFSPVYYDQSYLASISDVIDNINNFDNLIAALDDNDVVLLSDGTFYVQWIDNTLYFINPVTSQRYLVY